MELWFFCFPQNLIKSPSLSAWGHCFDGIPLSRRSITIRRYLTPARTCWDWSRSFSTGLSLKTPRRCSVLQVLALRGIFISCFTTFSFSFSHLQNVVIISVILECWVLPQVPHSHTGLRGSECTTRRVHVGAGVLFNISSKFLMQINKLFYTYAQSYWTILRKT